MVRNRVTACTGKKEITGSSKGWIDQSEWPVQAIQTGVVINNLGETLLIQKCGLTKLSSYYVKEEAI